MTNPFNKQVVFVFNMRIHLIRLAYKIISFCYYFLVFCCNYMFITIFVVIIVFNSRYIGIDNMLFKSGMTY